ncbi:unnamed protein product [Parnassius mnemosyne]|uniref:HAT C-terminal dimerisation domain-containing protein n=1 Tax=Parnassius mnemosyne TaxID=213953 RepID=A0AAV1L726_9NEOP
MGRKKINKSYRYFNLDENNKTSKCLVAGCEKVLKTLHGANLLKHLSKYHEKEYKEVLLLNKENYNLSKKPRLSTQDSLLQECTNLVTVHGRPLTLIDDHAFQNILSMIPNINLAINSQNVRCTLKDTADQLRSNLANEVRNLPICLKVDVASLSNRSFMGVNAQYIKDGQIVLRNLAVIELFKRHTSEHLKERLIFILRRFRIHNKQVYCITTDNGANILKMSRLFAADTIHIENNNENYNPEEGDRFNSKFSQLDDITHSDSESDADDVDHETENDFNDQIMQSIFNFQLNIVDDEDNIAIAVVRCAAHTLQLAMQDVCNDNVIQSVITSARNIIKRLRTPTFTVILKEKRKKKPTLDCSTRWHSTIDMVESILNLKDICATSELLYLPDETWNDLDLFLKSMLPGKKLTKILQKEQLTMGDFYIEWMKCQFELQKINTLLARQIICHMKHRQDVLFDNNAFLSAIYLDPRVNSTLTNEQQSIAQTNLINLYIHIQKMNLLNQKNTHISSSVETENMPSTSNDIQAVGSCQCLEDFLNSSYIEKHVHNISTLVRRTDLTGEITNTLKASFKIFLEEPLLKSSESVLKFWEEKQLIYPQLYQLARVALSVPATQVSVERLFSALKFIVSNLRMNLKDDIIEDILFVRCYKLYR